MFKRKHSIDTLISNPKRTAIRVGLQSPGIQLPVDIATASASGPTGLAFRISNIPSCITQDQFLQIVGRLGVNMPFDVGLPAPGYQNLLAWSFAPSVASADSEKYRTATVTFKSAPAEFQYAGASKFADFVPNAPAAVIDKQFYGLTPLYTPELPVIDIVAVTGLAGHAFGSWKARGGWAMWLRDFLPEHLPNSRILTYGYNSSLLRNDSTASIREFSRNFLEALTTARAGITEQRRPIVFIGHSLGGIVIKDALMEAAQIDGHHGLILQSCYAILLFGCPNRGLEIGNLRSMVKSQGNSKLIDDLDKDSNFLRRHNHFWKFYIPNHTRVVSIYETRPTATVEEASGWQRTGTPVLMVDRQSATYATPKECQGDIFSIDADHSNIVKFDNNSCQDYLNVRSKLLDLVGRAQAVISQRCSEAEKMALSMPGVCWNLVRWTHVQFRGERQEAKKQLILEWLSDIEYINHHRNALEGMLENTGRWLLEKPEFHKWRSPGTSGILWLHGIPGAGKTKLTCMVIETLGFSCPNSDSRERFEPVVYFYCSRNEPERRDPTKVLQALVKQMSVVLPGLPKSAVAKYEARCAAGLAMGALDFTESYDLLVSLLELYPQTTIIIDGLDESDPTKRGQFLDLLKDIIDSSATVVKFFISSRDDPDIKLKLADVLNLYIQAKDNMSDIERFIDRELSQSTNRLLSQTGTVRTATQQTLVRKADGMFQWVNLQLANLKRMRLEEDILENLGKLPGSLTIAYSETLKTMKAEATDREWALTTTALMWIMCARTLLTEELWTEMSYWPKAVPADGAEILFELCRNLVAWDSQLNFVKFAHLSINEYLDTVFTPIKINTMAAGSCLSLFSPTLIPPGEDFLYYSASYWPDHVEGCYSPENRIDEAMLNQLQGFMGTPSTPGYGYLAWYQKTSVLKLPQPQNPYTHPRNQFDWHSTPPNPLFAICFHQFGAFLDAQWDSDWDVNICNDQHNTLLTVACSRGNEWAVERLLKRGVSLGPGRCGGVDPLLAAIIADHDKIGVRLLHCALDRNICEVMLETVAQAGAVTLLQAFLLSNPDTDMLMARGCRIFITEKFITAAASHIKHYDSLVETILSAKQGVRLTTGAVAEIVRRSDLKLITILIAREPIKITKRVMEAAIGNKEKKVMQMFFDIDRSIEITAVILARRAWLEMVLARHPTISATLAVPVAGAMDERYRLQIISILVASCPNVKIAEETVRAAVKSDWCALEILQILLTTDPAIIITERIVIAAAKTRFSCQIVAILLTRNPNIIITEQIIIAAAKNRFNCATIAILLAKDPDMVITESILFAAAENMCFGSEIFAILLTRNPHIIITEQIVIAAVKMRFNCETLLTKVPDIVITEAILFAAAENMCFGAEIFAIVIATKPDIAITEPVLRAVAKSISGRRILRVLRTTGTITEKQEADALAVPSYLEVCLF